MSNPKGQNEFAAPPSLGLTFDEYREQLKQRLQVQDSALTERWHTILANTCPRTFGRVGPMDGLEELKQMLSGLSSDFRIFNWKTDEPIVVGEVNLDWFNLFSVLVPMRDHLSQLLILETGCDEVDARNTAAVAMLAQIEFIVAKTKLAMSEAFDLLLQETMRDAVNTVRAIHGQAPLPVNAFFKEQSFAFEQSLRRRSKRALTPRGRRSGSSTWQEFEKAILDWPSDELPPLGEFAISLPRYQAKSPPTNPPERQKDKARAKSAIKKELALLKREGFCPETNWPKLFAGLRSGRYPRYDPFRLNIDVDAGDESH